MLGQDDLVLGIDQEYSRRISVSFGIRDSCKFLQFAECLQVIVAYCICTGDICRQALPYFGNDSLLCFYIPFHICINKIHPGEGLLPQGFQNRLRKRTAFEEKEKHLRAAVLCRCGNSPVIPGEQSVVGRRAQILQGKSVPVLRQRIALRKSRLMEIIITVLMPGKIFFPFKEEFFCIGVLIPGAVHQIIQISQPDNIPGMGHFFTAYNPGVDPGFQGKTVKHRGVPLADGQMPDKCAVSAVGLRIIVPISV